MRAARPGPARPGESTPGVDVRRNLALVVDAIACDGHGVCAELFPERITLDRWGFPIVDDSEISAHLRKHAARAVAACPRLALHVVETRR
jgi:ferredoxin